MISYFFAVYIVPIGGLDVVGLISSNEKKDLIKFMIKILEYVLELAEENDGHQVTIIFDMDGFILKNYAWRPGIKQIICHFLKFLIKFSSY